MFKKGQTDMRELALTLVMAGVLFVVGLLIFSNVSNSTNNIFDPVSNKAVDEGVTVSVELNSSDATNSTLLANLGYVADSESVKNASGAQAPLTRNVDYSIALIGGTSGQLPTRGNFTLINVTNSTTADVGFNNTPLLITYNFNSESEGRISSTLIQTTVLDSFSLGVIALIVLAAVVILAVLFRLGTG